MFWVLQNAVHKEDASKLKYKLFIAFGENKTFADDRHVANMKSSMVIPTKSLILNKMVKVLTTKKQLLRHYHLD